MKMTQSKKFPSKIDARTITRNPYFTEGPQSEQLAKQMESLSKKASKSDRQLIGKLRMN